MATGPTPAAVAPMELAKRRAVIRTRVPLLSLPRLSAAVLGGDTLDVELAFVRDDQGRSRVRGIVEGELELECQRCLEPVKRRLRTEIDLCVVGSEEEAQHLDAELNPFVIDAAESTIGALIEDDVLLSLPVRVCERGDACPLRPPLEFPAEGAQSMARDNPFAVLRNQKRDE
jgi:DUF177 domain-containing protein